MATTKNQIFSIIIKIRKCVLFLGHKHIPKTLPETLKFPVNISKENLCNIQHIVYHVHIFLTRRLEMYQWGWTDLTWLLQNAKPQLKFCILTSRVLQISLPICQGPTRSYPQFFDKAKGEDTDKLVGNGSRRERKINFRCDLRNWFLQRIPRYYFLALSRFVRSRVAKNEGGDNFYLFSSLFLSWGVGDFGLTSWMSLMQASTQS